MNKYIAFGIIIGLLFVSLVILFCILLGKLYITKIRNYTQQLYQKDIDFQKALNSTIIETQEQVLNNISQDLHDDAGQQLTYINFQIENLKLDSPEQQHTLEPLTESLGRLSESIRGISHSLNNQLLTKQNLLKAIDAEILRIQKSAPFIIEYTLRAKKAFSTNEKIVIYRIFQEIMNNVLKHSNATKVEITTQTNPSFSLTIRDNGKGFDYNATNGSTASIGLQNMINRAAIIDYSITITSAQNEGTTIVLSENNNS